MIKKVNFDIRDYLPSRAIVVGFLAVLSLFVNVQIASAQQTIINMPSSEVLPAGDIIFKQTNRFRPFSPDEFVTLTPSATMGLGNGMEAAAAIGTTLDGSTLVRGDISLKKVWFIGNYSRLTVGGTVSPYLNESYTPDTFAFAHVSHRIKETKTSLTAGAYVGGQRHIPNRVGALVGIEQVIIPNKLRLAADWMSGDDNQGRIGVGLKYRPYPTVSITSAVIIPNKNSENIAFNISVSKFISLDDENPIKRRLKNVD